MLFEKMKNYKENVILSRSEGSHNKKSLHSLCSLRMTGDRTAPSLIVRGQNFLKNVVNLEIRERVKGKEILRSHSFLRMTKDKGVNVFSLSKREGNKKRKELINLSTYPLINFQKAFTLVEVLITLGIIGVVAAMTIPNLISNYQKHVIETNLKETYSILQQVMKFTEYDDVALEEFPDSPEGAKKWFTTYLQPHLKYSSVCYNKAGCWQAKGPTRNLAGAEATYNQTGIGVGYGIVTIKLTNGANLCLDGYRPGSFMAHFGISTDNDSLAVYIDANGDNPPNVIGKDIFIVGFTEKGLVPAGQNKTVAEINKNCSGTATGMNAGYFCLMKVKNHGWEIPNDVWKIKI